MSMLLQTFRISLAVLAIVAPASAQMRFTVRPERTRTTLNQPIRVTATLVSPRDLGRVPMPSLPASSDFTVLNSSRNQSSTSSINIVNGKAQRSVEVTYLFYYTISATKLGSFTFPSLSLGVGGKTYTTRPFTVQVLEETVESPPVLARLTCSKRTLYTSEQAVLTIMVAQKSGASVQLTSDGFRSFLVDLSESAGAHFSLVELSSGQIAGKEEFIKGERYVVYRVRYGLFPLTSGTHTLGGQPMQYNILEQAQRSRDPFGDFFGGSFFGRSVRARPATVLANRLQLTVKPLPPAPKDYCGVVGKASLSAEINPQNIRAGEAVTLKLALRGPTRPGSLSELQLPELTGFEAFTPEKHTYADTTKSGIVSRRTYKYLLIGRVQGSARIPPITVSYFDPAAGAYAQVSTQEFSVEVGEGVEGAAGKRRYLSQAEIREVGRDIRYIKTPERIRSQARFPHRSLVFYLVNLCPLCIVLFAALYRMQADRQARDPAGVRRRRATRQARKALSALRKQGPAEDEAFAADLSAVLVHFIADRFTLQAGAMTSDELAPALQEHSVAEDAARDCTALLAELDAYRFAAGAYGEGSRNEFLDRATRLIDALEPAREGRPA